MLIPIKTKLLAFVLLFLSVALTVTSLFVFSAGWETSNTVLLGLGTAAAIVSLFLFSMGWDRLKVYRDSGQISGKLDLPRLGYPLTFYPRVSVSNIDGSDRTPISNHPDGNFELKGVIPGEYQLSVEGYGLTTITRSISILSGRRADVGTVPLEFDPQQFWTKETISPYRSGIPFTLTTSAPVQMGTLGPPNSAPIAVSTTITGFFDGRQHPQLGARSLCPSSTRRRGESW